MISHLCNALIYQSGLFAGFYSTINLGDASIATEDEDVLVLEDGSDDKLITENGMVSGSIPGFYGYNKTFTPRSDWDVQFYQRGQVKGLSSGNRFTIKDIDCGANDCPISPVTELEIAYVGPNPSKTIGGDLFNKNTYVNYILYELDGSPNAFKYHWVLREDSYDFIAYITEQQYQSSFDPVIGEFLTNHPRYTSSLKGNIIIYQNEMILRTGGATEVIGDFA